MSLGPTRRRHWVVLLAGIAVAPLGCGGDGATVHPGGPEMDASAQGSSSGIPCEADRVLREVCQQCHRAPPVQGAPFPLVTWEDTHSLYYGKPIWQLMKNAVETEYMPLAPVTITPQQKATLLSWLDAGAARAEAGAGCP